MSLNGLIISASTLNHVSLIAGTSAAFEPEVRNRTCNTECANFGFAALVWIREKAGSGDAGAVATPPRCGQLEDERPLGLGGGGWQDRRGRARACRGRSSGLPARHAHC